MIILFNGITKWLIDFIQKLSEYFSISSSIIHNQSELLKGFYDNFNKIFLHEKYSSQKDENNLIKAEKQRKNKRNVQLKCRMRTYPNVSYSGC